MEEESDDEGAGPAPAPATAAANSAPQEVPHHILFLSNLPSEITSDMITTLCDQSVLSSWSFFLSLSATVTHSGTLCEQVQRLYHSALSICQRDGQRRVRQLAKRSSSQRAA